MKKMFFIALMLMPGISAYAQIRIISDPPVIFQNDTMYYQFKVPNPYQDSAKKYNDIWRFYFMRHDNVKAELYWRQYKKWTGEPYLPYKENSDDRYERRQLEKKYKIKL